MKKKFWACSLIIILICSTEVKSFTYPNKNKSYNNCLVNRVTNTFNPFQDTIKICGDSIILDAGANFSSYSWNNGQTTRTIVVRQSMKIKVVVTDANFNTYTDSSFVSIIKSKIKNKDTTICQGTSITLFKEISPTFASSCEIVNLPADLQNGLVGFYPFCGNANDISNTKNHGTINQTTFSTDRFGNYSSALSFNGISSYVQLKDTLPIKNNFTISFWFKQLESTRATLVCDGSENIGGNDFLITFFDDKVNIRADKSGKSLNSVITINNTTLINKWTHVVWKMTEGISEVFINGISIGNVSVEGTNLGFHDKNAYFGVRKVWSYFDEYFKGDLDDIAIYNRPLSILEIQKLYLNTFQTLNSTWSTGDKKDSTTFLPQNTKKYFLTVDDGVNSCLDSITISVIRQDFFNPLADTIKVCNDSTVLDAGIGYTNYNWNTNDSTQRTIIREDGYYKVSCINPITSCTIRDSAYVNFNPLKIHTNDTLIKIGDSITIKTTLNQIKKKLRYIKFESTYSEDNGQVNIYEIKVFKNGNNIALNKSIFANSTASWSSTTNLVDNNLNSRWSSNRADLGPDSSHPHYVIIDLNQSELVDSIMLFLQGFDMWKQTFKLKTSNDSANWTIIASEANRTGTFKYFINERINNYNYNWSNGSLADSIRVSPSNSQVYYLSHSNGVTSCRDSIKISIVTSLSFKLQSFQVKKISNKSVLEWKILDNTSVNKFVIERSINYFNFSEIGAIKVSNLNEKQYFFTDSSIINNSTYNYRLKIIEKDGNITYSNVIMFKNEEFVLSKVFPNPTNDQLNYYFYSDKPEKTEIIVYNILGTIVDRLNINLIQGENNIRIDTKKLKIGKYYIAIKNYKNSSVLFSKY